MFSRARRSPHRKIFGIPAQRFNGSEITGALPGPSNFPVERGIFFNGNDSDFMSFAN